MHACQCVSIIAAMKLILALFAFLAIAGLGQAHQLPDFGQGPLHEDLQEIMDIAPLEEINKIVLRYMEEDEEVKAAIEMFKGIVRDLMIDFEAIPEVINLFNYLHKQGIWVYKIVNEINEKLNIPELVPPPSQRLRRSSKMQNTGGLTGLYDEITAVLDYGAFIHIYAQKLQKSKDFVSLIDELSSNNFQQVVNKTYDIPSVQIILFALRSAGVKTWLIPDFMYILLRITVPNQDDYARFVH